MTLAFDVGGCSVLMEPSDQGRKPQPVTAHNRLGGMMWGVWPASCQAARRRLV